MFRFGDWDSSDVMPRSHESALSPTHAQTRRIQYNLCKPQNMLQTRSMSSIELLWILNLRMKMRSSMISTMHRSDSFRFGWVFLPLGLLGLGSRLELIGLRLQIQNSRAIGFMLGHRHVELLKDSIRTQLISFEDDTHSSEH